jgi:putative transposase
MRDIAAKLPDSARAEVTLAARAAYQAPSPALPRVLRDDLVEPYQKAHPTAVRCFLEDFEACIAHLACPPSVRKVIRTARLLERLFEEERRRTKTIHSFFGERPVLKLMYASVIRASDNWRGIRIGELEIGQLERLREQLINKHKEATTKPKAESQSSAPSPFYSKDRT